MSGSSGWCTGRRSPVVRLRVRARRLRLALLVVLGLSAGAQGQAQEFSRILQCEGAFTAEGKTAPAHADFALRFNNRTALVQRFNVLPVGEELRYTPSPSSYAMTYRLPMQGTHVVVLPGWISSSVLVIHPDLKRLNRIRLSISRQSGVLQGVLLNEADQTLAGFEMQCKSTGIHELEAPKF